MTTSSFVNCVWHPRSYEVRPADQRLFQEKWLQVVEVVEGKGGNIRYSLYRVRACREPDFAGHSDCRR